MPISKSAIKAARQTKKKHAVNKALNSRLKTLIKKVLSAKTQAEGKKLLDGIVPEIQRAVTKNILHKNNGAHKISRLTRFVAKLKKA